MDFSFDLKILAIGSPRVLQVNTLEICDCLGSNIMMWKQLGQNITDKGNGNNFGGCVSLYEDGKTVAVII